MSGLRQSDQLTLPRSMKNPEHFYRCFGCSKEHPTEGGAKTCCAVVQEIWRCRCGEEFASVRAVFGHLQESGHRSASFDPQRQTTHLARESEVNDAKAV